MSLIYPAGDEQVTPNIGLATWGMDEVLAENMILIDAAIGGPTDSIKINGSVVPATNFINSASVTFSVVGSNVSATATSAGSAAWSTLTGTLSNGQVIPYADAGISRLGAASLAIGNGTNGDVSGTLTLATALAGNGSRTAPSISFASEPDMGLYRVASQALGIAIGTDLLQQVDFSFGTTLCSNGSLGWATGNTASARDTSISRIGASILALGNGTAGDFTGILKLSSVSVANGAAATPSLAFYSDAGSGAGFCSTANGAAGGIFTVSNGVLLRSDYSFGTIIMFGGGLGFSPLNTTSDTTGVNSNISSLGAASLAIGNGTAGNFTGTLKLDTVNCYRSTSPGSVLSYGQGLSLYQGNFIAMSGGTGAVDSGISRLGAASLAIGNGTAGDTTGVLTAANITVGTKLTANVISSTINPMQLQIGINTVAKVGTNLIELGSNGVFTWNPQTDLSGGTNDTGISRLGPASLAIGTQTQGDTTGNLSLNRINKAGADFAGQATVTAGNTTQAVTFAANYAGTGQPVIVLTPTSDPLAAGLPVGYWVTYSGGAGAWTGWVLNIQTALAGNITFNYCVIGVA